MLQRCVSIPSPVSLARKPVTATSDVQLSAMRSRIAELKAQIKGGGGDRDSTGSLGVSYETFKGDWR